MIGTSNATYKDEHIHIVESGRKNNMYYRLWSDNTLECWYHFSWTISSFSAWGSLYNSDQLSWQQTYPYEYDSRPVEIVNYTQGGSAGGWLQGHSSNSTTKSGTYKVIRPTNPGGYTAYISMYVIGKKKV